MVVPAPLDRFAGALEGAHDVAEHELGEGTFVLDPHVHTAFGTAERDAVQQQAVGLGHAGSLVLIGVQVDLGVEHLLRVDDHDVPNVLQHLVGLLDQEHHEVVEGDGRRKDVRCLHVIASLSCPPLLRWAKKGFYTLVFVSLGLIGKGRRCPEGHTNGDFTDLYLEMQPIFWR